MKLHLIPCKMFEEVQGLIWDGTERVNTRLQNKEQGQRVRK